MKLIQRNKNPDLPKGFKNLDRKKKSLKKP
jgi:hypothetical protein